MTQFFNNAVFWIEVDKVDPNPFQPRKEFNQQELQSLADSIRQYGVLQALVVTRREEEKEDGGLQTRYELISGERRLRASRLAGVREVPVLIRSGEEDNKMKLELAIIENIQREDLNVVDRARAFQRLIDEFSFSHRQVAQRVGKSREYVSNSIRVLVLPEHMLEALSTGKLSEGHARPLGMLSDRPEEQETLFKEIVYKKMSVREAERIARRVAYDKVRKKDRMHDPALVEIEESLSETFGTRVQVERKQKGGRISIDFFSDDDLETIMMRVRNAANGEKRDPNELLYKHMEQVRSGEVSEEETPQKKVDVAQAMEDLERARVEKAQAKAEESVSNAQGDAAEIPEEHDAREEVVSNDQQDEEQIISTSEHEEPVHEETTDESTDDDLYSVRNFTI